jgi:hypothetical protein
MMARRKVAALAVVIAASALAPHCTAAPSLPAAPSPSAATTQPSRATSATAPPAPAAAAVRSVTAAELGASWRPDCPVEPGQLRRVEVNHIGMDGQMHRGELIPHFFSWVLVIAVFQQLYQERFPIEKIRTVDRYPAASDELSMEDNNTSAFNCRRIRGNDDWSLHAYGRAVDLNPLLNPSVDASGTFEPTNAVAYLDRRRTDPGILHDGDPATHVFTDRGWRWGGYWKAPVDYQHFELP